MPYLKARAVARRWVLNIVSALSLLLAVSVAILGVRGFWTEDMAEVAYRWYPTNDSFHERWLSLRSLRGTFEFGIVRNDFDLKHPEGIVSTGGELGWVSNFIRRHPRGFKVDSVVSVDATDEARKTNLAFPTLQHTESLTIARHDEYWSLQFPAPYLLLIFALPPGRYILRAKRQRTRRMQGLCLACGYDMRGSGAVCPECGTHRQPIASDTSAALQHL